MQDPLHYASAADENSSWLRLAVRKNVTDDAMYCLLRMDPMDAWIAMIEASLEDVGLCDPFAAVEAMCSYEEWQAYEKEREHGVSQAVMLRTGIFLARAPKSRVVDNCKILHLVHLEPEIGEEDKTVSLDPFRTVRLDTYRLSDPESWPVRQSLVCVARAIMEKDDDRALKSAVRLHVMGKGHLVWAIIACMQDRHEDCYGWSRACTQSYAKAWRLLVTYGNVDSDRPSVRGLAAIVQGVLLLPFRHNVPHEARKHPWGFRTVLSPEGFPQQRPIQRSDMPYWLDLAKKVCNRMEQTKKRPMPDTALDMTTLRGRTMGRGVRHFFERSTIHTNVPTNPPVDSFRELAIQEMLAAEARMPLRNGFQSLIDCHREELRHSMAISTPVRTPSPMERSLLPGSTSSSLDEIPSSPESPSKKRRTMRGGVVLPPGLKHRFGSKNLGYIVRIDQKRLAPGIVCNRLRRLLSGVGNRPPFVPKVLNIRTNQGGTRGALVGQPWSQKGVFENLVPLEPETEPLLLCLGCLAFRYVFEVRGGVNLIDPSTDGGVLYSFGERTLMAGTALGSFRGAWREFMTRADGSGALDAAIEAMALWKLVLTKTSDAVAKAIPGGMQSFVRIMKNVETLLSKEGWFTERFFCSIGI